MHNIGPERRPEVDDQVVIFLIDLVKLSLMIGEFFC